MDLDGKKVERELGGVGGGSHNQNVLYAKDFFSVKAKSKTEIKRKSD